MLKILRKYLSTPLVRPFCSKFDEFDNILSDIDSMVNENRGMDLGNSIIKETL